MSAPELDSGAGVTDPSWDVHPGMEDPGRGLSFRGGDPPRKVLRGGESRLGRDGTGVLLPAKRPFLDLGVRLLIHGLDDPEHLLFDDFDVRVEVPVLHVLYDTV